MSRPPSGARNAGHSTSKKAGATATAPASTQKDTREIDFVDSAPGPEATPNELDTADKAGQHIKRLMEAQRFDKARESLAIAAERFPDEPFVVLQQANLLDATGTPQRALAVLKDGVARFPFAPRLRQRLRRLTARLEPSAALAAKWEQALAHPNAPAELAFDLVELYRRLNRPTDAARVLESLEQRWGKTYPLISADVAAERGDAEGAVALLDKHIAAHPKHAAAICKRALVTPQATRKGAIEAACLQLAALPQSPDVLIGLVELNEALGNHKARGIAAAALVRTAPHRKIGHLALIKSRLAMNDRPGALDALNKAPAAIRADAGARALEATLLWETGALGEAVAALNAIPETQRPNEIHARLIRYLCLSGRASEAEHAQLAWQPSNRHGRRMKAGTDAVLSLERLDHQAALTHADYGLTLGPNDRTLRYLKARALVGLFRPDEARDALAHRPGETNESANLPQAAVMSFLGALINELRLDVCATEDIAQLIAGDPNEALAPLAERVKNNSMTGPALGLLIAMRKAGRLTHTRADGPPDVPFGAISPRFVLYSEARDRAVLEPALSSAQRHHPGAEVMHLERDAARLYLHSHFGKAASNAFDTARHALSRADLVRLAILTREGGIVIDPGTICRGNLGELFGTQAGLVLYQEAYGSLGTGIMASVPDHPWVTAAFDALCADLSTETGERCWLLSGPGFLSRAFARAIVSSNGAALSVPADVTIYTYQDITKWVALNRPLNKSRSRLRRKSAMT